MVNKYFMDTIQMERVVSPYATPWPSVATGTDNLQRRWMMEKRDPKKEQQKRPQQPQQPQQPGKPAGNPQQPQKQDPQQRREQRR